MIRPEHWWNIPFRYADYVPLRLQFIFFLCYSSIVSFFSDFWTFSMCWIFVCCNFMCDPCRIQPKPKCNKQKTDEPRTIASTTFLQYSFCLSVSQKHCSCATDTCYWRFCIGLTKRSMFQSLPMGKSSHIIQSLAIAHLTIDVIAFLMAQKQTSIRAKN